MREVEHAQRNFQSGVKFFELCGDLARVAARTIGTDDQSNHGNQSRLRNVFGKFCLRQRLRGQRRRPFCSHNRQTMMSDSRKMRPDILEWPSMRSVKTIGTSMTLNP